MDTEGYLVQGQLDVNLGAQYLVNFSQSEV